LGGRGGVVAYHGGGAKLLARSSPFRFQEAARHSSHPARGEGEGLHHSAGRRDLLCRHETVVPKEDGGGLPKWRVSLFSVMDRNAAKVTDFFKLPVNDVVEIGREIAI
jgi:K+ transporter